MVKVLILHSGAMLVQGDAALPHLREALEVLSKFETGSGKALILSLIADYPRPSPPVMTDQKVEAIFSEYVSMLDKLDLKRFFEPVDRHITLAADAGALQLERRIFAKAIQRLRQRISLSECLFITPSAEHVIACRKMGMKVLRFDPEVSTNADFSNWSEAPLLIARIVAPDSALNKTLALQERLATAYDMQLVSINDDKRSNLIHGRAKKLFPILLKTRGGRSETIEVPFPVNVEITLDKQGNVSTVKNDEPDAETVAESAHFIKTLEANKQISHGPKPATGSETHRIEVDAKGRKLLTRKRFTAT